MKKLPPPDVFLCHWLHDPRAITVAALAIAGLFLVVAGWQIQRNLRHNEPGLRAPLALPFALMISAAGIFGAGRLPSPAFGERATKRTGTSFSRATPVITILSRPIISKTSVRRGD